VLDKLFKLDIVTPKKVPFCGDVVSFIAPGVEGSFQILHNHTEFLSAMGVGDIKIKDESGKETHYATSGGVVEVDSNKVIVLAETIEKADEIDVARAEASKERAAKLLAEKRPDLDAERAKASLARALNRLKVAGKA
jgi:F-type H+-transporting ATPase subunit epsilon